MRGSFRCSGNASAFMLALITMVRIGESSGPDVDDETESEKLSGDDGGFSSLTTGAGGATGSTLARDVDGCGDAGDSAGLCEGPG